MQLTSLAPSEFCCASFVGDVRAFCALPPDAFDPKRWRQLSYRTLKCEDPGLTRTLLHMLSQVHARHLMSLCHTWSLDETRGVKRVLGFGVCVRVRLHHTSGVTLDVEHDDACFFSAQITHVHHMHWVCAIVEALAHQASSTSRARSILPGLHTMGLVEDMCLIENRQGAFICPPSTPHDIEYERYELAYRDFLPKCVEVLCV